ncbi:MAG: hypothetical protein OEY24_07520 [Candidatus Bathyarchaeota archaeon]|nr:hypothetical protein [Candidatus Bathyarchaeota archaeon]MDH5495529.1 hypothetical protein [Candidatus Bathyarchaeota archaeon]
MPNSNLILPYAIEDSGRKKRFSENMEVAALLGIAEAERKKKSGLFRGAAETLTFISKLYYPLWAIPWENNCLLIDGMETIANNILYFKPPNVENFIEHLKSSTTVQELYHSTLRSHQETFSDFTSQTEIPMEGYITDEELLSDMSTFIKDSRTGKNTSFPEFTSLIQPKIDEENAVRISERVMEHYNTLQSEIKGLKFAIDTVNEETEIHIGKLRQELEQTREKYEGQISNVRVEVEKRTGELEKEREEKIEKITATNEKEVNTRLEERKKWEQELLRLEQNKSEYEKRKELRKRKSDEVGEARWDARLRDVQNQISTVKGKIKALSDFINRSSKETEKTTKKLHDTYQNLVDEEEKKITDLESLRDSEIDKNEKKIEEMGRETLAITDKIERLVEQKRERSSTLKEATIPWKTETLTLIHVPFYLIQYEVEKKKRHCIRPPIVARGHEGFVVKIRKTFRRYSTLLKPRSKVLEKLLTSFEERLGSDKKVQRKMVQLGMSHNLLTSVDFKEKVRKGIEELEVEGWIKPEEKATMLETYVTS